MVVVNSLYPFRGRQYEQIPAVLKRKAGKLTIKLLFVASNQENVQCEFWMCRISVSMVGSFLCGRSRFYRLQRLYRPEIDYVGTENVQMNLKREVNLAPRYETDVDLGISLQKTAFIVAVGF